MKDEQASLQIKETFKQAVPQVTTGKYRGMVLLTPSVVKRLARMSGWKWKPGPLTPRYEFKLDPSRGATSLWTQSWTKSGQSKPIVIGIYEGGVDLPQFCCKCMSPVTRYEVVELGSIEGSVSFQSPNMDAKKAGLVVDAWAKKRYWYALPFCQEHDLSSKAVILTEPEGGGGTKIKMGFTNQEYGRQFGELNGLKAPWLTRAKLLARMASYLLYILSIGGIGGGGFALYEQAKTGVWEHLPLALGFLLVGLAILGGAVALTLWVKGTIGKKEEA